MNVQKVLSIILIICGVGVILLGFAFASGESTTDNMQNGVYGIAMLALGLFIYFKKPKNST